MGSASSAKAMSHVSYQLRDGSKVTVLHMKGKISLAKKLSSIHVLPHIKPISLDANCTETTLLIGFLEEIHQMSSILPNSIRELLRTSALGVFGPPQSQKHCAIPAQYHLHLSFLFICS